MSIYTVATSKGAASVRLVIGIRSTTGTLTRGDIRNWMFSCEAAPADAIFIHQLSRYTTAPTGANPTLEASDPDEVVALATGDGTVTTDPTIGSALHRVPLNHRASFRWVAAPGSELIHPSTADNGIGWTLATAVTTDFGGTLTYNQR